MIELFTLGSIDLKEGDRDLHEALVQPKRFALLAYLAGAQPTGYQRRDRIVALFWPELDQEHARTALRKAVHGLRAVLGEDAIVGRGTEELALTPGRWWADLTAFDAAFDAGDYAGALRLYRGELLDGFFISGAPEFERWLDAERSRVRRRAAAAASRLNWADVPDDPAGQRALIADGRQALPPAPAGPPAPNLAPPPRRPRIALFALTVALAVWGVWRWERHSRLPVTTSSVPAYRLFVQGLADYRRGDFAASESLMVRASALDTTFALAEYYAASSAQARSDDPAYRRYAALAQREAVHAPERERLLIRATFAEQLGAPDALPLADSLVRRHPEEGSGQRLLGLALLDEGDFLGAIPHLETAERADTLQGRAATQAVIYAYGMADSIEAAVRTARNWVRQEPGSAVAWHELAAALELADRGDEALAAVRNAARLRAGDAEDAVLPGVVAFQGARFEEADRVFQELMRSGSPDVRARARWEYVISLRNQGRLREALAEARRYRAEADSGGGITSAAPEAQVRFERGDFRGAGRLFDSIAAVEPQPASDARAARNRAWYLTHVASALAAAGDTAPLAPLADSVERVGRASAYGRDHLLHYHIRGLLALARGRVADAAALFARANYSLTGGFSRNNLEWARALIALGRSAEAIPILRGALNGPPDASGLYATFADVHELLGRAFDLSGGRDSAAAHYRWVEAAWRRADPSFRPREEALRTRLAALDR